MLYKHTVACLYRTGGAKFTKMKGASKAKENVNTSLYGKFPFRKFIGWSLWGRIGKD